MEHRIEKLLNPLDGFIDAPKRKLLIRFAEMIESEGRLHNITGHKTIEEIVENLVVGSILPFRGLSVPRGTSFVDIGSGAGIPGVPLSILLDQCRFLLVDSDSKKTSFVRNSASVLGLDNVEVITGRVEEVVSGGLRVSSDWVVSRAMASEYVVAEMAAPFLKLGGKLYIYSNRSSADVRPVLSKHCSNLGLVIVDDPATSGLDPSFGGILFLKHSATPEKYPRRYPVIKRESERMAGCMRHN